MTPQQKTIVVVDDDATTRAAMTHLLEMEDYAVHTASDGRQAMDVIAAVRPAIVLSDVRMPVMDGEALVAAVRANNGPPVILMTGHAHIDEEKAARIGAAGILHKPVRLDDVLDMVTSVLGKATG